MLGPSALSYIPDFGKFRPRNGSPRSTRAKLCRPECWEVNVSLAVETSSQATVPSSLHVVRRAIFARDLSVWGYELMAGGAPESSSHENPSDVRLLNAIAELGVKPLVGDKLAVIAVTRASISGNLPLPAGTGSIVLELCLGPNDVNEQLVEAVDERLDEGFQLALSGVLDSPGTVPLIRRAKILRLSYNELRTGAVDNIDSRPRSQSLWIDGVDEPEYFPRTRKYGPHYFSGDFLLKPSPVEGRRAPRNVAVLMDLITALQDPDVRFSDIELILRKDAGLSVTLLRFLNSAGFGLRVQVSTIRQAVALLGIAEFSKWVTLVGLGQASVKPNEVLLTALVRAKTCELIAGKNAQGGTAFMVGLFSLLDAMMDQSMETVLEELPVSEVLKSALLDNLGFEGEILAGVLDHERGLSPDSMPQGTEDVYTSWRQALAWAEELRSSLPQNAPAKARRSRRR